MDRSKGENSGKIDPPKRRSFAMKTTKFTEEQIAFALRQSAIGTKVAEVCQKMRISEAACYYWKTAVEVWGEAQLHDEYDRRLVQ